MLLHIHLLYDSAKPRDSDKLEQTEKRQYLISLLSKHEYNIVKRYCCKQINQESSFEVLHRYGLFIKYFFACEAVIIGGLKL